METMRQPTFLQLTASAMAAAIATIGIGIPAFGADPSPTPTPTPTSQPAPTSQPVPAVRSSVIGQCRAVNKKVSVYKQALTTSAVVSTLNAETKVTLADNGSSGFIGISSPVSGYLQTANLKPCSGTTPPPTGNTCRLVVQPLGLAIRKDATPDSAMVGGVGNLERLTLTTSPATAKRGPDGRNWVQIAKPAAGWVSNGFPGGSSNLVLCP